MYSGLRQKSPTFKICGAPPYTNLRLCLKVGVQRSMVFFWLGARRNPVWNHAECTPSRRWDTASACSMQSVATLVQPSRSPATAILTDSFEAIRTSMAQATDTRSFQGLTRARTGDRLRVRVVSVRSQRTASTSCACLGASLIPVSRASGPRSTRIEVC